MEGWAIRGVELPFGDQQDVWWVDMDGVVGQVRLDDAEELPGSYFFSGLVGAHAHPAVAPGPAGPVPLDVSQTSATLLAWVESGVTLVRDVGSPGGVTLDLPDLDEVAEYLAQDVGQVYSLLVTDCAA